MTKAFAIYDPEIDPLDGNGGIVFAECEKLAVSAFCTTMHGGDGPEFKDNLVVKREPSLDQYYNQRNSIPKTEMAKIGFFVECDNCGTETDDVDIIDDKVYCDFCDYSPPQPEQEGE